MNRAGALRDLIEMARVDGRPAFIFVNNRLEGNSPAPSSRSRSKRLSQNVEQTLYHLVADFQGRQVGLEIGARLQERDGLLRKITRRLDSRFCDTFGGVLQLRLCLFQTADCDAETSIRESYRRLRHFSRTHGWYTDFPARSGP